MISSKDYNLRYNLLRSTGVEKNEHKAFKYFQKATNDDYDKRMFQVGYCYRVKAFEYYKEAADGIR